MGDTGINEKNVLELLDIYMEMVEKQDEIIYRMSHLLKEYATELAHLRNINGCIGISGRQRQDENVLQECMKNYNVQKEQDF